MTPAIRRRIGLGGFEQFAGWQTQDAAAKSASTLTPAAASCPSASAKFSRVSHRLRESVEQRHDALRLGVITKSASVRALSAHCARRESRQAL